MIKIGMIAKDSDANGKVSQMSLILSGFILVDVRFDDMDEENKIFR